MRHKAGNATIEAAYEAFSVAYDEYLAYRLKYMAITPTRRNQAKRDTLLIELNRLNLIW